MTNGPINDVVQSARSILRKVFDESPIHYPGGAHNGATISDYRSPPRSLSGFLGIGMRPRVDVWEDESVFTVLMDIPGVSRDSIRVVAGGDEVAISGDRRRNLPRGARSCRSERTAGHFERIVHLGRAARPEHASVRLDAGVLEIRVPKGPGVNGEPTRIELSSS
jgi:HSP20 family molecular chaperone IbpA